MIEEPQWVTTPEGQTLAVRAQPGRAPWVVFLGGFRSDMEGTKAQHLAQWCAHTGQAFLRFDYSGHGLSQGSFAAGTISRWSAEAVGIIQTCVRGPCVLVGSSMGGWIMLHVAQALASQVVGLLGIAAAPDFTRELVSRDLTSAQRDELQSRGQVMLTSDYDPQGFLLTQGFINDGEAQCLLDRPIRLNMPVRLLQGCADAEVPWRTALRLADALDTQDVRVQLFKDGDHRLSSTAQLAVLTETLAELLKALGQSEVVGGG